MAENTDPLPTPNQPLPPPPVVAQPPAVDEDDGDVCEESAPGAPAWIVTFADMMSLLLCFFVLLLSFSVMDAKKFKAVADSMREAFSFSSAPVPGETSSESTLTSSDTTEKPVIYADEESFQEQLQDAKREIDQYIANAGLSEHIQTKITSNSLEIVNSNPLNFPPGKAELLESSLQYLDAIIPALKRPDFRIVVEGHTDNVPINTLAYRSNWELSAARAASFVSYLEAHGVDSKHLAVHGYGPNHPIAPNDTDENRARNRRIEIMVKSLEADSTAELTRFHLSELPPTSGSDAGNGQ